MLSLSDNELELLLRAAAVIPEAQRDSFLRALAVEMRDANANDKLAFAHVINDLQRQWIGCLISNPPE